MAKRRASLQDMDPFERERLDALLSLDEARIKRFCLQWGVGFARLDGESFWAGVHKARVVCRGMPEYEREQSRQWLTERGFAVPDEGSWHR